MKKKLVLDVPRRDPNAMEVDKHRKIKRCYNYGKIGHLIARCSKLRKERREELL